MPLALWKGTEENFVQIRGRIWRITINPQVEFGYSTNSDYPEAQTPLCLDLPLIMFANPRKECGKWHDTIKMEVW